MSVIESTTTGPCPCCNTCAACTSCKLGVLIYNCNGITDDDFNVYLNGVLIGTAPELFPDPVNCNICPFDPCNWCRGTFIHATGTGTFPPDSAHAYDCGCVVDEAHPVPILTQSTADALDVSELAPTECTLTFQIESTDNNQCSNYGVVTFWRWCGSRWCLWSGPFDYAMASDGGVNAYSVPNPCCTWYCTTLYTTDGYPGGGTCTEFPTAPPDEGVYKVWAGPYYTEADCAAGGCGHAWYCVTTEEDPLADPTCVDFPGDGPNAPPWGVATGPYFTEGDCLSDPDGCGGNAPVAPVARVKAPARIGQPKKKGCGCKGRR
jgi:hypothetical protein